MKSIRRIHVNLTIEEVLKVCTQLKANHTGGFQGLGLAVVARLCQEERLASASASSADMTFSALLLLLT